MTFSPLRENNVMITQLENMPPNAVGFKAEGTITKEDFEQTVNPSVKASIEKNGKLNYLLVLDTDLGNFSAGAWLQDALLGIKHLTKWNRAAIVSDSEGVKKFTDAFSILVPGEFKGFSKSEQQEAIKWVSEELTQQSIAKKVS